MAQMNDAPEDTAALTHVNGDTRSTRPRFDLSVWTLIGANLIPLVGVLFFSWDAGIILIVYWAENLVVGCYNIPKMILARAKSEGDHAPKIILIPFFCIHFGGFCAVHGAFVLFFVQGLGGGGDVSIFPDHEAWWGPLVFVGLLVNVVDTIWSSYSILWPVIALFVSHGVSFVENYLLRGEYRERGAKLQMFLPYARIFVMHVAIILAAVPVMLLGSPIPLLVILVGFKIVADVALHMASHKSGKRSTLAEAARRLRKVGRR